MINDFKHAVELAQRILITSHTSPDPDAVASLLLLGTTLETNFKDKKVRMVLEEEPSGLDFLQSYSQITFQPLLTGLEEFMPDLFIIVDTNTYDRVSRHDELKIKDFIQNKQVKSAIIDHHEPDGKDQSDIYINDRHVANVQQVYDLCFSQLGLQKPQGYTQTTMLGLYADSGGFAYHMEHPKETFELVAELAQAGASIEDAKNRLNRYTDDQMKVIAELSFNLCDSGEYSYTFLSDEFVDNWVKSGKPIPELQTVRKKYVDDYIRNVNGRQWGFLVCRDPQEDGHVYSISFRAVGHTKDVSLIARKLNGGGHKPSAGGKVEASNIKEAIKLIQDAIAETP